MFLRNISGQSLSRGFCCASLTMVALMVFVSLSQPCHGVTLVSVNGAGSQQFELRTVDTTTGVSTVQGGFTTDTGFWFPNTLNVDNSSGQVTLVSSSRTLHEMDVSNANVLNQHPLAVNNLQSIRPRGDGMLVGLNSPAGSQHTVHTFDPSDGSTVALNSFTFDSPNVWYNSTYAVDEANSRLYGLSAAETLYEWDATTGAVLNTTTLDVASNSLTFARTAVRTDGKLVGVTTGGGSNQIRLIDPADPTGTTTQLLNFTFDSGGFFSDTFVADPANDRFYVASSAPTLYEFSMSSGQILSTKPLDFSPQAFALYAPAGPSCAIGDADCDGYVSNLEDIQAAFTNFTGPGTTNWTTPKTRAQGDVHDEVLGATTNPAGHDQDVDNQDIQAMFTNFNPAPSDASDGDGASGDGDPAIPDLIYDPITGEVVIDWEGNTLISYVLKNETSSFIPGNFGTILLGSFPTSTSNELSESTSFAEPGVTTRSMGNVFPAGLDLTGLQSMLTVNSIVLTLGGPQLPFDLVVLGGAVPEPSALWLALTGLVGLILNAVHRGRSVRS